MAPQHCKPGIMPSVRIASMIGRQGMAVVIKSRAPEIG